MQRTHTLYTCNIYPNTSVYDSKTLRGTILLRNAYLYFSYIYFGDFGDWCIYTFTLKGISAKFTHLSAFTGLGEYDRICEKSNIKPSVAPEEAACNWVNSL